MAENGYVNNFFELNVYRDAFQLQQQIFVDTKRWPKEELPSLVNQVRRSSRAIGANLAEAWAKRRCASSFLSRLTDVDGEIQETLHWLKTAVTCGYLTQEEFNSCAELLAQIGRQLGAMIRDHQKFCKTPGSANP